MSQGEGEHGDVSVLLNRVRNGDAEAVDRLADVVYAELRDLATAVMRSANPGHTLQPTALVHEVWLKMARDLDAVADRKHFFAIAARAMRQVLIDHARGLARAKRGGGAGRVTLCEDVSPVHHDVDLLALSESLERLRGLNDRHAAVLELRLFGALTIDETADVLSVSAGTVKADWTMARAWLRTELEA